jgi:membrane-bound lytic murein transglycosylase MltF
VRCALVVLACAFCGAALARDLPEMKDRGSLRVLVAADEYPAWFSLVPGPDPGLERELIEGFARLHRLKLEVVAVARFEEVIPMLQRGEGDVIMGINDTVGRRKVIDFTHEVMPSRHVVVTRKPHPAVLTLQAFRAERVSRSPRGRSSGTVRRQGGPALRTRGTASGGSHPDRPGRSCARPRADPSAPR